MASKPQLYYFTGEPGMAENAINWLSTIEANICQSMTNREKWFNRLPDEGHRRWHLVHEEFKSRWCKTAGIPILVALLSTSVPAFPQTLDTPTTDEHLASIPSSPTMQPSFLEPCLIQEITTTATTATVVPSTFTVSFTPLLHPEPAATHSGTNAIQVTQFELNKMLRQSFKQGLEYGHQIDLADAIEKVKVQYKERLSEAFNNFAEREQDSIDLAFAEGYSAGIREELDHRESTRTTISTQTEAPTHQNLEIVPPTFADTSQTPAMPEKEISAGFSAKRERSPSVATSGSLTPALAVPEPLAPHAIVSAPEAAEIVQKHPETRKSHVSTQKLLGTPKSPVSMRFSWADDAETLHIVSTTPTNHPRDLSGLPKSDLEINGMGSPQFFLFKMTAKGLRNEDVA
ncbi:hypothetical protein BYT27DRAFT_7285346 [Phlegmacium glaucopus]|nr:hypothetical protein BYT27DRAFT_7285346 [Phlegmacium glaucopus]